MDEHRPTPVPVKYLLPLLVLGGLWLTSTYSYLLFHTSVELFSVIVACAIFIIAWNTRRFTDNAYFLFIGIGCLFVGVIDLLHTLAYKNMGVFGGNDPNLPTQFWIVARYLQSATFALAPLFLRRRLVPSLAMAVFAAVTLLLVASIFAGIFPDCFVEGSGLTPFKIGSEYVIALTLAGSLFMIRSNRDAFVPDVIRLLYGAIVISILSELAFTLYTDVFGILNMLGHFLKLGGFVLIYKALIEIGLRRPYDLLFRELKKSEEALLAERNELRESEERYRHLYKDTPVMLHSIDRGARLVNVSNYWLEHLGYSLGEILGRKVTDFFTEASRRQAEETIPEFFRTGLASDLPLQVVKKNGEVIDVLLSASASRDETGDATGSFSVMVDVTERKRAEEKVAMLNDDLAARAYQLQVTNTELEAFNYTVSHDLRAPLANIGGCCSVIREMHAGNLDETGREFLGMIESEVQRMGSLISTLLNFSRLGRQELKGESVDLTRLATLVSLELKMRSPGRSARFQIAEGMTCTGDPTLLKVALDNLLGNAWKYTGNVETAEIEFGKTQKGGENLFFVRDNGVGFDKAQADKLFLPFQRLHSKEFEGFGIGLATVQKIIYRHGGRIFAEGTPGAGASFYFTLGNC